MSRAVELVAARGGTMPWSDLSFARGVLAEARPAVTGQVFEHIAAQGAKVASLEQGIDTERQHDLQLRLDLGATESETLRGAVLRMKKERDDARTELERAAIAHGDALAELARLKPSGQSSSEPRELLKAWLAAAGRTQKDFATAIGVTASAMSYYLSGRNIPLRAVRRRIEDETGGQVPFGAWPEEERGWNTPHASMASHPRPSGQGTEDVEHVRSALADLYAHGFRRESADGTVVQDRGESALSRLAALAQRTHEADLERDEAASEMQALRSWVWGGAVLVQACMADTSRITRTVMTQMDDLERRAEQAESQLRAIRERAADTTKHMTHVWRGGAGALLDWVLGGIEPNVPRDPRSPTCTHTDAATSGHAGRVAKASEEIIDVSRMDPLGAVEMQASITQGVWNPTREQEQWFDSGAEAMRAACWKAVALLRDHLGITSINPVYDAFKAAIEGAAP
jgi:transcriptional regulator with XRE-family HTH domain